MELGQRASGLVVADDEREVAAELACLVAMQQIDEAVVILRDEEGDVLLGVGELDAPVHLELAGDGLEGRAECGFGEAGGFGDELDAHEEEAKLDILMLVGVEDVDVVALDQEVDDGDDNSFAVGTVDKQDCDLGVGHSGWNQITRFCGGCQRGAPAAAETQVSESSVKSRDIL